MSPAQKDYTGDSRPLVPGSLTVFRHFQADLRSGVLTPMSYNPRWDAWAGAPSDLAIRPYSRPAVNLLPDGPSEPERPVYQAGCSKRFQLAWRTRDEVARYHKSPDRHCTCGFYASYDPATDFYPSYHWGRGYSLMIHDEGAADMALVKAAVEVSGKVVMGRLGVRAEKMKILGLTLDWSKRIALRELEWGELEWWRRREESPFYRHGDLPSLPSPSLDTPTDAEDEARAIGGAQALAYAYGAEFYDSVEGMVRAHPMADVSALGVDTSPPRRAWGDIDGAPPLTAYQRMLLEKTLKEKP